MVFVTISGAHLYGFASADSDVDLRGVHVLPSKEVVGLNTGVETIEVSTIDDGLEVDLVTHDIKKFMTLMLRRNGYVLEQLYSPLIVRTTPEHDELKQIGELCITKHHAHHYFGFAETQWKLFGKESPRRVKPLLYVFRVLLTGIHLMRTGRIEANIVRLNEGFRLSYIDELVARKVGGKEKETLSDNDYVVYDREYHRLREELQTAHDASSLREVPNAQDALHDLLLRLRGVR